MDQSRFQDAVDKFDRAIEIENSKLVLPYIVCFRNLTRVFPRPPPINVLPLVNKGLALFQWKQDIAAAEQCCEEALQIDPECEAAVATLAQLSMQQTKTTRAHELFERQVELARSEPELVAALQFTHVCDVELSYLPCGY